MEFRNSEVVELINTAPKTLCRITPPVILTPEGYGDVSGLNPLTSFDNKTKAFLVSFEEKMKKGSIRNWNLNAREILSQALEIPKSVYDHEGYWFLRALETLSEFVENQRFGSSFLKKPESMFTRFHNYMRTYQEAVRCNAGCNLWEIGIIIQSPKDEILALSYCLPWDSSWIPWYKRLTPEKICIGREAELEAFSQAITGRSIIQNRLESAFNINQLDIWWDQAQKTNRIVRGRYEEVVRRIGPSYADRLLRTLKEKINGKQLYEAVQEASFITGYYITAGPAEFPGAVDTTLHIDQSNWVEPAVKMKRSESAPGSYEDKKKKEPESGVMWRHGGGYLYNDDCGDNNGSFSVFVGVGESYPIGLKGLGKKEIVANQIQLYKKVKMGSHDRTYHYYVNHPDYGDSKSRAKRFSSEKNMEPLGVDDWKMVWELFQQSLKRGVVDSSTYWNSNERVGLTEETRKILESAKAMLTQKMVDNGFDITGSNNKIKF